MSEWTKAEEQEMLKGFTKIERTGECYDCQRESNLQFLLTVLGKEFAFCRPCREASYQEYLNERAREQRMTLVGVVR